MCYGMRSFRLLRTLYCHLLLSIACLGLTRRPLTPRHNRSPMDPMDTDLTSLESDVDPQSRPSRVAACLVRALAWAIIPSAIAITAGVHLFASSRGPQ